MKKHPFEHNDSSMRWFTAIFGGGLLVILAIGFIGSSSIRAAEIKNGGPINIYLPAMPFLLFEDSDSVQAHSCKKLAFDTVNEFSQAVNSNLVRQDKKLRILAGIVYGNCLDLQINNLRNTLSEAG